MVSQCSITLFYRWLTWHLNVNPFWSNSVIKYISLPTDSMLDNTVACKSNILYLVFFFFLFSRNLYIRFKKLSDNGFYLPTFRSSSAVHLSFYPHL